MHRKRKIVVNLALIAAALLTLLFLSGVYLTADNAVRAAERGMHYGPSQTVYTLDSQGGPILSRAVRPVLLGDTSRETVRAVLEGQRCVRAGAGGGQARSVDVLRQAAGGRRADANHLLRRAGGQPDGGNPLPLPRGGGR